MFGKRGFLMSNILEIIAEYSQLIKPVGLVFAIIGLALAVIACFFGYRFQKIWVALLGFGIGALLGHWGATKFVDNSVIDMLIAIIAGFFVAVLACAIHMFGVVLLSFFFGFGVSAALLALVITNDKTRLMIAAIIGAVLGVLSIFFTKIVIVIVSALYGGFKIADYVFMILEKKVMLYLLGAGLVLAAIGVLVQWLTTRKYTLDRGGDRLSEY